MKLVYTMNISYTLLILQIISKISRMNSTQKQQIDDFIGMTNTSRHIATEYLTKCQWNFQNAVNRFFDDGAPMPASNLAKSNPEIQKFFNQHAVEVKGVKVLNQEGLQAFLNLLKIDMSDIVIGHIMINCMEMKKSGQTTKEQFYNLFQYTKTKSFKQLFQNIPTLRKQLHEKSTLFKSMYDGMFDLYSVTQTPTLDFDVAVQIWDAYLKTIMPFHKEFIQFLENLQKKPAKVYRDLWSMTYQFATTVKNVQEYKQQDGWPVLIDDFMADLRKKGFK